MSLQIQYLPTTYSFKAVLITVDSVRQKPHIYSLHNLYILQCPWQYAQLLDVEQAGLGPVSVSTFFAISEFAY